MTSGRDAGSSVNRLPDGDGWVTATLRWTWGADDDASRRELFTSTPATWIVLGIVCAVSLADFALGPAGSGADVLTHHLGFSPAGVAKGEWWRLVTTALVNPPTSRDSGIAHLLFNVVGLVLTGPRVERAFGRRRFFLLLFVATVSATVAAFVGVPLYWVAGGGTSGGVFGLIGAALVIGINRRRRSKTDAIFLGAAVVLIAVTWLQGLMLSPAETNISHFGGFIAGMLIAAAWCYRSAALRVGTSIAVALLVIGGALAVVRTADVRRSDLIVQAELPVGFAPEMLTPGYGSIWVTGEEIGQVVRIDERSGRVSARIRETGAGGLPVVTDGRVWVAGRHGIAAIDPSSNRVVSRIRLPGDAWPWGLAATKDALWAAVSDSGEVVRVDLRTREQKRISVGEDPFVVATAGSNVWVTSYGSRTVSRLDSTSGEMLGQRRLATRPYQMAVLDGSLWVGAQPFVYRLDPESLQVIARINVASQTWTLTPDEDGMLLVATWTLGELVRLNPETNTVERRIEMGLRQPIAVAFGKDMWIADAFRNLVMRTSSKMLLDGEKVYP